jgi:ubiquinone/menaquinone biosynthesis C-methylase UbiE
MSALDTPPLADALSELFALRARGADPYLDAKTALRAGSDEVLRAYAHIRAELAAGQRVLDWGCRHGAMSWLARRDVGASLELHGCDVCDADEYADFHRLSGLAYRRIEHPWRLDYADASFDAVIAAGTLEHVPNDGESLTELWRVIKPDGALLVTHLPNAGSWSEWLSRRLFPAQAHARRYRLAAFRERLLHHGFEPMRWGRHQLMPAGLPARLTANRAIVRMVDAVQPLNAFENVWPLRHFAATIWIVARKRRGF